MDKLRIELEVNTEVNFINGQFFIKEQQVEVGVRVYISCADVRCFVGVAKDRRDLFELIGPKNIVTTLSYIATEYQWDALYTVLVDNNYEYYIGEDLYKAI